MAKQANAFEFTRIFVSLDIRFIRNSIVVDILSLYDVNLLADVRLFSTHRAISCRPY